MASPLASTFGVWLVSIWLETILYGMGLLQVWLYFHWYPKDHWSVKLIVSLLTLTETLQITVLFADTYVTLIDNFGNIGALADITWLGSLQLIAGYTSAFIVQIYFGYSIYRLDEKRPTFAIIIMLLALLQIGAGIAQTVEIAILDSFASIDRTKPITSVESAASVACDIGITLALFIKLKSRHSGVKSTNTILQKLTTYAINRGILTSVAAALNLILFLAISNTFYFFLGLLLCSKLYMNSMLASLNTRQYISNSSQKHTHGWQSIALENLVSTAVSNPKMLANSTPRVDIDTALEEQYGGSVLHQKTIPLPDRMA